MGVRLVTVVAVPVASGLVAFEAAAAGLIPSPSAGRRIAPADALYTPCRRGQGAVHPPGLRGTLGPASVLLGW